MKKVLSLILSLVLAFCCTAPLTASALDEDVELDMEIDDDQGQPDPNPSDPETGAVSVSLEKGEDSGYLTNNGDTYTAVPYAGNEFLGWFTKDSDTAYSTELTAKLPAGEYIAKFKDNNILASPSAGFELGTVGENLIGNSWGEQGATWARKVSVSDKFAKSGKKSLELFSRYQHDIYADITGLENDTYYIVSYYWMLPKSVITDTATARDGYYGSVIGTSASTTDREAMAEMIGGDYNGTKNISFVGGQWNKVEYVFNSADYTNLRMFISYDSESKTGNDYLYIDEFTVYKAPDQQAVATYKATVSAENGYAYSTETKPVAYDTEVTVVATPFGGYVFDGWYEDGVKVSSNKIYTFNIRANRALVAKCVPASGSVEDYVPDMDASGGVDLQDVVLLAQYVAGWDVQIDESVIDVNGKGGVDLNDVVLLAQYVAGWDVADQMPGSSQDGNALPCEDLTDPNLKTTLLAGKSEYYNKSTVINEGNKARIAKVLKKAQNGEDITIVGFGGSITEGARATTADNQYGSRVAQWFRDRFPNITVDYINAGIGSTTSLLGVHRIKDHVLAHNPDFVLVDFTTNDSQGDLRYRESYETIIRTLLENDIAVLSVLYGSVTNYSAENAAGSNNRANNSLSTHLPSLLYYDMPTIDYYGSLWRYINAGVINWTDVAGDYIHPSNNGHLMAASAINYYLSGVLDELDGIDETVPAIPDEYFFKNDIYETATFLGGDAIQPTTNTNFVVGNVHGSKLAKGWICTSAQGGSITFEIKGVTSVFLLLQHKSGNSTGSIVLNGKTVVSNANCDNSSTGGYVWIAHQEFFDEPTDITVTVTCNSYFGFGPIGVTYAK